MPRRYKENGNDYFFDTNRFLRAFNELYIQLADEGKVSNMEECRIYFAKQTNYSEDAVRSWLRGKTTPSQVEDVKVLAAALSVDYKFLLTTYEQADFTPYRKLGGKEKTMRNRIMDEIGIKDRKVYEGVIYTLWNDLPVEVLALRPGQFGEEKNYISALLGIDTSEYSFEYLASWASSASCEALKSSLEIISSTAASFAEQIQEQRKEMCA